MIMVSFIEKYTIVRSILWLFYLSYRYKQYRIRVGRDNLTQLKRASLPSKMITLIHQTLCNIAFLWCLKINWFVIIWAH